MRQVTQNGQYLLNVPYVPLYLLEKRSSLASHKCNISKVTAAISPGKEALKSQIALHRILDTL
jgi:hypothetical protein